MTEPAELQIAARNFGPLRDANLELRPLTLLIGPNNTGKSYVAQLTYALWRALSGNLGRPFSTTDTFTDFLDRQLRDAGDRVSFSHLPQDRQQILKKDLMDYARKLEADIEQSLCRYLGCNEVAELVRSGGAEQRSTFEVGGSHGGEPFLRMRVGLDRGAEWGTFGTDHVTVPLGTGSSLSPMSDDPFTREIVSRHLWSQLLAANGFPKQNVYYLPAARSGVLQGLEVYTTVAFQAVWQGGGAQPLMLPAFSGVAGDFLQLMVTQFSPFASLPRADERLQPAIDVLEGKLLGGQVVVAQDATRRLSIVYASNGLRLPIPRTSSMVAELAPLDLYIKHVLRPGDVLIIDEPEAHLHPENQRLIARVLVRLVRAGVRIICPTHSSMILHQISNHILATQGDPGSRERVGLTDDDLLDIADVGVYLFEPTRDGTQVSTVPIEPDYGISEDEFVRVAEAIGEDTYWLTAALNADLVEA